MSEAAILELSDLRRTFIQGEVKIDVLRGVSFRIAPGEVIALTGPSGAGKSTLLQIAGLLERPDGGEIKLAGKSCAAMSERLRTRARREMLGFVYQFHHLLPEFSALENVMLPQLIGGTGKRRAREHASELLEKLGVAGRQHHRPTQLSGGEQQRVAIARALANRPVLLLADEPTGNLDQDNANNVFEALMSIVRDTGLAALVATHNLSLAARMDRHVAFENGVPLEQEKAAQ
ncbi:MAG: ABC transporter ATP-binding protein [Rhodospirillaceae bacterium]|nr:ABC transporter ATP-binding protein [Rhodospirillaceae bacterium]